MKKSSTATLGTLAVIVIAALFGLRMEDLQGLTDAQSSAPAPQPQTQTATPQRSDDASDKAANDAQFLGGQPEIRGSALTGKIRLLDNDGFVVAYSEGRKNPLWVAYKLRPLGRGKPIQRPDDFLPDRRTDAKIDSRDYSRSGYTRGHLAPNYHMFQLYGKDAQLATFLMSNITPQKSNLNGKLWQRLEEVELSYFTKHFKTIQVFTGPVFDKQREHMRSGVEIPDAFFKVYVAQDLRRDWHTLAFVMPQNVKGTEPLTDYLTNIDDVERQTGIDFLALLSDDDENRIEADDGNPRRWGLDQKIANLPPRY